MRNISFYLSAFLLTVLSNVGYAQDVLVTNLAPGFGQVSANQFSLISITNTSSEALQGQLISVLTDLSGEVVAELRSYNISVAPGETLSSTSINWSRRMTYGSSKAGRDFSRSGVLGFGAFNFCSTFFDLDGLARGQSCLELQSTPIVQFSLVFPHHKSEIQDSRPVLTWENIGQYGINSSSLTYEIRLAELLPEQSVAEALEMNPLLLHRKGIRQNSLLYPIGARPLLPGKSYAWTVAVFAHNEALLDAQQWSFTIGDTEEQEQIQPNKSCAMLDTRINNRAYYFEDALRIGFDNNEGLETLPYRIIDLSDKGGVLKGVESFPELTAGLNTLTIPLKTLNLKKDHLYQLEVSTTRGQLYYFQFRIKP